ncbi:HNH nuclease [Kalmanozyma brasiliensis GHG001]|uniref:HNH nuclease n=1 Tax=Kalmanozyma brasiliensis (strain GHG001) TaxID=1365824 RepID=UPI002867F846|nr:HNH nuclease [Kalmanozyma brasiliensis GHG001]KAF6767099.1 HNH nuclease [Kalmanozyma brasiliensis GHG001]
MTNSTSRLRTTPPPWPSAFQPSGALWGQLPITVPRLVKSSPKIVVTTRVNGITSYEVHKAKGDPYQCLIDTDNEWMLTMGLSLNGGRCTVARTPLARLVAGQTPTPYPDRIYVDHANRNTLDNTRANLHWVTPAFNRWNMERKEGKQKYFGVRSQAGSFHVRAHGQSHGTYKSEATAARVYNLVCKLEYGDQLIKTPHLLNDPDQKRHVVEVGVPPGGVQIFRVDDVFVVTYEARVRSTHKDVDRAEAAAYSIIAKLRVEQARIERARQILRRRLHIRRNKDGVAYVPIDVGSGKTVDVLLSDDGWLDIHAASARLKLSMGRPCIYTDQHEVDLARWLCRNSGLRSVDVVDHINWDPFDDRMTNLRIKDRAANAQNWRRKSNGFTGVYPMRGKWQIEVKIKGGTDRARRLVNNLDDAIELYDLATLSQHGVGCHLNRRESLGEYLLKLDKKETKAVLEEFLAGKGEKSCKYIGVRRKVLEVKRRKTTKVIYWSEPEGKGYGMTTLDEALGSAIRCAISWDLWRVKVRGHYKINFEQLRPCYQHWAPQVEKTTQAAFIEKAYELLGGDDFAIAEGSADGEIPSSSVLGKRKSP